MAAMSNYLENALINEVLRATGYTAPTTVLSVTSSVDFFVGSNNCIYSTCSVCLSESIQPNCFAKNFPDAIDVIPKLAEDFFKNPTSTLVTMKCFPWTYEDKVALIGDSAHAIVPFYGHGMNAGFEDITVLDISANAIERAKIRLGEKANKVKWIIAPHEVHKSHIDKIISLFMSPLVVCFYFNTINSIIVF